MKQFLVKLAISVLAVFAPIQSMLISALCLIMADLVLGVMAAHKQKIPITSAGFRRTVTKVFVYLVSIMLGYVAQHFLMKDSIQVSSIIASFVGLVELKSCLENLNLISGQDLLKSIISKLGSENQPKP